MAVSNSISDTSKVNLPACRKEAKTLGQKRYFNGKPCKHGHISERLTINGSCCECTKLKDKRQYWENREENLIKQKSRRDSDPELSRKKKDRRRAKDPGIIEREKLRSADHELRSLAREAGDKFYKSSYGCPKDHQPIRFSSNGKCVECNRIACREKWERKQTPEDWAARKQKAESLRKRRIEKEKSARLWHQASKSRQAAIASGAKTYESPKPCTKGHVGLRYLSGSCVECCAIQAASEEKKLYDTAYQKENRDRIFTRMREYRNENKEHLVKKAAEWAKANPQRVKAIKHTYKVKRRAQEAAGMSSQELSSWVISQKKVCYWCGYRCDENYHIDHYQPLSKGGAHEADNLVIACQKCNLTKSAKDPYDFAQQVGRLF